MYYNKCIRYIRGDEKMIMKCAYYLKLLLIVALTTTLFASVEIAPDRPIFFMIVTFAIIIANRLLWNSVLKDEAVLRKKIYLVHRQTAPGKGIDKKQAA